MRNEGAAFFGMKEANITKQDSVDRLIKVIDGATREETGGRFPFHEGGEFPW